MNDANNKKDLHSCDFYPDQKSHYGYAADYCFEEEDGSLWVGNGEYDNTVNFCPFCGYEAKKQGAVRIEKNKKDEQQ